MTTVSSWLRGYAQFAVDHCRSKDMPDRRIMGFLAGPARTYYKQHFFCSSFHVVGLCRESWYRQSMRCVGIEGC